MAVVAPGEESHILPVLRLNNLDFIPAYTGFTLETAA